MTNNVVLKDIRKTIKVELPSFPGSEVELYDGLLFGQMKQVGSVADNFDKGVLVLQFLIKDWNFTNENGEKIPVNGKVLNEFPVKDLTILMNKANTILEDIGKKKETSLKKP